MNKYFIIVLILGMSSTVISRVVNMHTIINKDIFGNPTNKDIFGNPTNKNFYTIENTRPTFIDHFYGTTVDQSMSFNKNPFYIVKLEYGDSVKDTNNHNIWYKTNLAGQLSQRCLCPGFGIPCSCNNL